jgi:trk system potassium uptake protein
MPGVKGIRVTFAKIPKPSTSVSSILLVISGFLALILIGTIFLMLPVSSVTGTVTSPITALFTSTSAVCVTGLIVVDTGTYWSSFGQAVLLALFQLGGLGFLTLATLLLVAIGRKFGFKERLAITEAMGTDRLSGALGMVVKIAIFSLVIEIAGAAFFYFDGLPMENTGLQIWTAVFHSVSAFNNCGMDIMGKSPGFAAFQGNIPFLLVTALLVIIGSTGYVVLVDFFRHWNFKKLLLDSKIVIITTISLLVLGTVVIYFTEYCNSGTLGLLSWPHKLAVSFFQAVMPRTAGFSVVDMANLKEITLFFVMFLMLIGGSVGSTAGGIKTNTLGLIVITLFSLFRGKTKVEAFERKVPDQIVFRAFALLCLYLSAVALFSFILSLSEPFPFEKILFELFSAFSTVGLSTGITPDLSVSGKIMTILAMFIGRLGPLSMMAFLAHRKHAGIIEYPYDNVRLG